MQRCMRVLFLLVCFATMVPESGNAAGQCSSSTPTPNQCTQLNPQATKEMKLPDGNVIQVPTDISFFSAPLCLVDSTVRLALEGVYENIAEAMKDPIKAILMLYIIISGLAVTMGLINPRETLMRMIKIAVVWLLIANPCFFYTNIYQFFVGTMNELSYYLMEADAEINNTPPPNASNPQEAQFQLYANLDKLFDNVVGIQGLIEVGFLVVTFLLANGTGITTSLLTFLGVGVMFWALLKALVTFAVSFIGITFVLLFAPLFLSFFLFQATRVLFDSWIKILISFVLQPFIIFAVLVMLRDVTEVQNVLSEMMSLVTQMNEEVPWIQNTTEAVKYGIDEDAWNAMFGADANMDEITRMNEFSRQFMPALLVWVITNMLMLKFIGLAPNLAWRLSGGFEAGAPMVGQVHGAEGAHGFGLVAPGVTKGYGRDSLGALGQAAIKSEAGREIMSAGRTTALAGLGVGYGALKDHLERTGQLDKFKDAARRMGLMGGAQPAENPAAGAAGEAGRPLEIGGGAANINNPAAGAENAARDIATGGTGRSELLGNEGANRGGLVGSFLSQFTGGKVVERDGSRTVGVLQNAMSAARTNLDKFFKPTGEVAANSNESAAHTIATMQSAEGVKMTIENGRVVYLGPNGNIINPQTAGGELNVVKQFMANLEKKSEAITNAKEKKALLNIQELLKERAGELVQVKPHEAPPASALVRGGVGGKPAPTDVASGGRQIPRDARAADIPATGGKQVHRGTGVVDVDASGGARATRDGRAQVDASGGQRTVRGDTVNKQPPPPQAPTTLEKQFAEAAERARREESIEGLERNMRQAEQEKQLAEEVREQPEKSEEGLTLAEQLEKRQKEHEAAEQEERLQHEQEMAEQERQHREQEEAKAFAERIKDLNKKKPEDEEGIA